MGNRVKPSFKIVEIPESERDYEKYFEEFKKDYLNPNTLSHELIDKYSIPKYVYKDWSRKIRKEHGLSKKPCYIRNALNVRYHKDTNIYKLSNSWGIRKHIKGKEYYFRRFPDKETVRMVRDKLQESEWDMDLAEELIKKYGYKKRSTAYINAIKHYDEFKELYLNVPIKYDDILKKLGISANAYRILVNELRQEIPNAKKKSIPRRL